MTRDRLDLSIFGAFLFQFHVVEGFCFVSGFFLNLHLSTTTNEDELLLTSSRYVKNCNNSRLVSSLPQRADMIEAGERAGGRAEMR